LFTATGLALEEVRTEGRLLVGQAQVDVEVTQSVSVAPQVRATYNAGASIPLGPFITGHRPACEASRVELTRSAAIRLPAGRASRAHLAAARVSASIERVSAAGMYGPGSRAQFGPLPRM
jgi:hypothetical protein